MLPLGWKRNSSGGQRTTGLWLRLQETAATRVLADTASPITSPTFTDRDIDELESWLDRIESRRGARPPKALLSPRLSIHSSRSGTSTPGPGLPSPRFKRGRSSTVAYSQLAAQQEDKTGLGGESEQTARPRIKQRPISVGGLPVAGPIHEGQQVVDEERRAFSSQIAHSIPLSRKTASDPATESGQSIAILHPKKCRSKSFSGIATSLSDTTTTDIQPSHSITKTRFSSTGNVLDVQETEPGYRPPQSTLSKDPTTPVATDPAMSSIPPNPSHTIPSSLSTTPSPTRPAPPSAINTTSNGNKTPSPTSPQRRFQPRSPFTSKHFDLSKKKFPGQSSGDQPPSSGEDEGRTSEESASRSGLKKKKEYITAAQALADVLADNLHPSASIASNGSVEPGRTSKESFGSRKSSLLGIGTGSTSTSGSGSAEVIKRESVDSHTSSQRSSSLQHQAAHHAYKLFGSKSQKQPSGQGVEDRLASPWPSPSSSAAQHSPSTRRKKMEARDDRLLASRPPRPRFTSTRSDSSVPVEGESSWLYEDDEDDFSMGNERRSSIPVGGIGLGRGTKQRPGEFPFPSTASTDATSRTNALQSSTSRPPHFPRSQSYDARLATLQFAQNVDQDPSGRPPHLCEMKESVHIWVPEDPNAPPTSSKTSSGGVIKNVLLGSVPRKKVLKKDSSHQSSSSHSAYHHVHEFDDVTPTGLVGGGEGQGSRSRKGKSVDRAPHVQVTGRWKRCEICLSPTGNLTILSDHALHLCLPVSALDRTDIRTVDQSLLGRQRVLAFHTRGLSLQPPGPSSSTPSNFPLSPSAPDFSASASLNLLARPTTSSGLFDRSASSKAPQVAAVDPASFSVLYLAFPTAVTLHTWMAAFLAHSRPEVYPTTSRYETSVSRGLPTEGASEEESSDDDVPLDQSQRRRWRHHRASSSLTSDHTPTSSAIRINRSISLKIIEYRRILPKDSGFLSLHGASSHVNTLHLPPSIPAVHEMKRTASIASGSAASTASSEDVVATATNVTAPIPPLSRAAIPPATSNLAQGIPSTPPSQGARGRRDKGDNTKHSKEDKEKHEIEQAYAEISLGNDVVGRTAAKRVGFSVIWQEAFELANLSPLNQPLCINIWQIKKNKAIRCGGVTLNLQYYPRNHTVEDWFPIVCYDMSKHGKCEALAEISMSVRIRKDITLSGESYSNLHELLKADKSHELFYALLLDHPNIEIEDLVGILLRIALHDGMALSTLLKLCDHELRTTREQASVLFRGNSLLSKSVDLYMRIVGEDYLEASLGEVLRQIIKERVDVEIDPVRLQQSNNSKSLQDNITELENWTTAVWNAIYNARNRCPADMRALFRGIQERVEAHFFYDPGADKQNAIKSEAERSKIRFTCVSAFLFLRFLVPAVLNPRLFGLCHQYTPDIKTQRSLTLIAKTLQVMANMQSLGNKEPYMVAMNSFLQVNAAGFEDFISYICAPIISSRPQWTSADHDKYRVPSALRDQLRPRIVQEGVPTLPFLVDLPKELGNLATSLNRINRTLDASDKHSHEIQDIRSLKPYSLLLTTSHQLDSQAQATFRFLERRGEMFRPVDHGNLTPHRSLQARIDTGHTHRSSSSRSRGPTLPYNAGTVIEVQNAGRGPNDVPSHTVGSTASSHYKLSADDAVSKHTASNTNTLPDGLAQLSISHGHTPTKRRSHTISALSVKGASPSPYNLSKPLPIIEPQNHQDVLEIHMPLEPAAPRSIDSGDIDMFLTRTAISIPGSLRSPSAPIRPRMIPTLSDSVLVLADEVGPAYSQEVQTPRAAHLHSLAQMQQQTFLPSNSVYGSPHKAVPSVHSTTSTISTGIEPNSNSTDQSVRKSSGKGNWFSRTEKV